MSKNSALNEIGDLIASKYCQLEGVCGFASHGPSLCRLSAKHRRAPSSATRNGYPAPIVGAGYCHRSAWPSR
jgi:hypothetical protein